MLFNSVQYMVFLPIVVSVYFVLPDKIKKIWLLFASYYFYMCWNPIYIVLIMITTIITYIGGLIIQFYNDKNNENVDQSATITLILALITNFGLLFYFKYFNFAIDIINFILSKLGMEPMLLQRDILLPVGISFFTFQAVGYLIDVYRKNIYAESNLMQYALFVSFFPQLVAGPIERSKNLLRQLDRVHSFSYDRVKKGLLILLWGFFLKIVIADRCAVIVDTVYNDVALFSGIQLWLAIFLFSIEIYCDFMGYSIIAKGSAIILGYELMDNFKYPYFSTSVKEFWRRWHISLSTWFRDYVYIPLGGNKCSKWKRYRNLMITFLISGLWHGANIKFVIWGGIHVGLQILEEILEPIINKAIEVLKINTTTNSWKYTKITFNFVIVSLVWVFFRANNTLEAINVIRNSFDLSNFGIVFSNAFYSLGLNTFQFNMLTVGIFVLFSYSYLGYKNIDIKGWFSKQNFWFRYGVYWGAVMSIVLSLDVSGQEFIYFQF